MRGLKHNFRCGDRVYDKVDPRHVGRIKLIDSGLFVVVEWRKGLYSTLRINKIGHAEPERCNVGEIQRG
jgi:hypothetical protein